MTKNDDESFNIGRAELFEAMGHPNRIRILKVAYQISSDLVLFVRT